MPKYYVSSGEQKLIVDEENEGHALGAFFEILLNPENEQEVEEDLIKARYFILLGKMTSISEKGFHGDDSEEHPSLMLRDIMLSAYEEQDRLI